MVVKQLLAAKGKVVEQSLAVKVSDWVAVKQLLAAEVSHKWL